MKELTLDIDNVCGADEFYNLLGKHIELPAYFGRNLDALYDVLTEEPGGIKITLVNTDVMEAMAPKFLRRLKRMLEDVADE